MSKFIVLLIFISSIDTVFSQNVASTNNISLEWRFAEGLNSPKLLNWNLSQYAFDGISLPSVTITAPSKNFQKMAIYNLVFEKLTGFEDFQNQWKSKFKSEIETSYFYAYESNAIFSGLHICPFKVMSNEIYYLKSFDYLIESQTKSAIVNLSANKRFANNSVLATGKWLKFAVSSDGFYKITKEQLIKAGLDLNVINPKTFKIYSHHGGMLEEQVGTTSYDDIPENAIQVIGEDDNTFDDNDAIVFYAQSPNKWKFDTRYNRFKHEINIYNDKSYYFLTYGGLNGKRVQVQPDNLNLTPEKSFDFYDYLVFHDDEKENICNEGRIWLGERMDQNTTLSFTENVPNITNDRAMKVFFEAGAISFVNSNISMFVNNSFLTTMNLADNSSKYSCFSDGGIVSGTAAAASDNVGLRFVYNKPLSSSKAWFNYYELHATRKLDFFGDFLSFKNIESRSFATVQYQLSNVSGNAKVYDITDPLNIKIQNLNNGSFNNVTNGAIKEFAIHNGNFSSCEFVEEVLNQNFHSLNFKEYIIIAPPDFKEAAQKLANYHINTNNMTVEIITPQQIYNEYSSGSQDVSAIRNFMKHLSEKNNNPVNNLKYLLLLGDASFDYKDKIAQNTNYVPTFESEPKWDIPKNFRGTYFCSDDYYCFLSDGEGDFTQGEKIEISVGRMPVVSAKEAMEMVNKVIHYKSKATIGSWRNDVTLCADDMDASWEAMFIYDFEQMADVIDTVAKNAVVKKIYLDLFKQENLSGSQRYPEAQEAIKKDFANGTLIFNYVGHGGEQYLASEKVIDIPLISSLTNYDKLSVIFTATCEFSRFDDAKRKSAGEIMYTNPNGGAIAMFTTTRVVYAGDNADLTKYFWSNCAYAKVGGKWPTLGNIYKKIKNRPFAAQNDKMFSLFGDPAMTMNYPENIVVLDSINKKAIGLQSDTMKALDKMSFAGHIEDVVGSKMNAFNGKLNSTFFDKKSTFFTLGNDNVSNSKLPFSLYSNILFKGENSIQNGNFNINFVVPKDINYNFGFGKINFYADNTQTDGWGSYRDLMIGGTNTNAMVDVQGPELEIAIDDYSFVNGGITSNFPTLLARLNDEHGINTSGNGIGRDIVAIIDKGTINEKRFVLNSFYKAALNSYQSGEVAFKLEGVAVGKHTYTLKAWDVYNNSNETTIEFYVKPSDEVQISNLLNYPNPFSTRTIFHFDHNQVGGNLDLVVNIYTISGQIIKRIYHRIYNANAHVSEVEWDGKDDYGDKLSKGVYVYTLSLTTEQGKKTQKTEKLVILN